MQTSIWLPPVAAFVISFFTSMGGISGAFLLLPLQMSVLGFTSPAVSATNFVFNLVATPAGVYRYAREKRVIWPLALLVVAGTLPGVVAGGFVRLLCLPDAKHFKVFVGLVLLWLGIRLVLDIRKSRNAPNPVAKGGEWYARTVEFNWRRLVFEFRQRQYRCKPAGVFVLSLIVGLAAAFYQGSGMAVAPNWTLGLSFGVGGMAGMYLGARVQRFVPATYLKILLASIIFGLSISYVGGYLVSRG